MKIKKTIYWTALAVTGLGALALKIWAVESWFSAGGASWRPSFEHAPHAWAWAPLVVLLVVGVALWYRRRNIPAGSWPVNPWETLGLEYAEGRITREEFLARRTVLEEQR